MTQKPNPATLALEDGTLFRGTSFGAAVDGYGEVCFNTSMAGYQEILTDPSYAGQMVCMTYPHMGNYGVNDLDMESVKPWVGGFIVREFTALPSNFRSASSLDQFLKKNNIPGIAGVDTRALTKHLRDHGAKRGMILQGYLDPAKAARKAKDSPKYVGVDWVSRVTTSKPYEWTKGLESGIPDIPPSELALNSRSRRPEAGGRGPKKRFRVVALDCGIKQNILRNLVSVGCQVTVVPASTSSREILSRNPDGIFLSNGPGDPEALPYVVQTVREVMGKRPIFGICLGHQMLGLALGGKTFKLKFGHRGGNQPVMDLGTRKVEITSQNHGFAVDPSSFRDHSVVQSHINLNDRTSEGLSCERKRLFSVQYHPEASPGPHDANYLFSRFVELMKRG
jgi:carbamoyl-phosphate synthase small subunit